ncbi:MAG: DNA polymerase III subunit beta [Candidatus Brocadiales bacterium]|nr:DNA polymerase III subunit beta [Candidatus Bathyanammoxibius sp.]
MKSNGTMKVNQKDLLGAMRKVQKVTDHKANQPILANVLIETRSESKIAIQGTDFEQAGEFLVNAVCNGVVSFTVNAKRLTTLLRKLPKGSELTVANGKGKDGPSRYVDEWATISANGTDYNIATMPVEEYPPFPIIEGPTFKVCDKFWEGVAKTIHATSTDETRYTLNGIKVEIDGEMVKLIATDGHQMAVYEYQGGEAVSPIETILPRKGIHTAHAWFKGQEAWLTLGDNHGAFWSADRSMIIRNIEGQFPNYEQIIEERNDVFTVDADALKTAIGGVAIMASDKSKGVLFEADMGRPYNPLTHALDLPYQDQHIVLRTEDTEIGNAQGKVAAEINHYFKIYLNSGYVLNALKAADSERVAITFHDHLAPIQIRPVGSDEFLAVVMPMRF